MKVRLKAYGVLRSLTGELPDALDIPGHTLGDLVGFLGSKYGRKVKEELLDEKGDLDFSYAFFVSGERTTDKNAPLRDGDEVVITNMLGGGWDETSPPFPLSDIGEGARG